MGLVKLTVSPLVAFLRLLHLIPLPFFIAIMKNDVDNWFLLNAQGVREGGTLPGESFCMVLKMAGEELQRTHRGQHRYQAISLLFHYRRCFWNTIRLVILWFITQGRVKYSYVTLCFLAYGNPKLNHITCPTFQPQLTFSYRNTVTCLTLWPSLVVGSRWSATAVL